VSTALRPLDYVASSVVVIVAGLVLFGAMR